MVLQVRVNEVSLVAELFLPKFEFSMICENGTENGNGFVQFSCPLVLFNETHGNEC